MNKIKIIFKKNKINIYGDINFENIKQILESCFNETKNINKLIIDFKYTTNKQNCILIFILNYLKKIKNNNQKVKFINIPKLLNKMVKVYNLYTLI